MPPASVPILLRNVGLYASALVLSLAFLVFLPLLALPRRVGWPVFEAYLRGLLWLLDRFCGLDYDIRGLDRLPPGPCIIAVAHQSNWENLFLPLFLRNPAIIVKNEVLAYPLVGWIARKNGDIAAHRSGSLPGVAEAMRRARQEAGNGRSILIFPTGTRSGIEKPPPLRRGVAALYRSLDLPCVPVAHNSGLFWRKGSWLKRPGTVVVEVLDAIPPGLPKAAFLSVLSERLEGATARLMQEPSRPALMPELTAPAERLAGTIAAAGRAGAR